MASVDRTSRRPHPKLRMVGNGSDIVNGLRTVLSSVVASTLELIRTRLNEFSPKEEGQLINWGYAITDTAMRSTWVVPDAARATTWPIAEFAL